MYDDDVDEQHPLYNFVKNERGLSLNKYEEYQKIYSCDHDTVAYRGLNFRTPELLDNFLNSIEDGKLSFQYPQSFSPCKSTAEDFSSSKKSYFFYLDKELALESEYYSTFGDKISGYAGVVIETIIPKGQGIDLNKTHFQIEPEIIFSTQNKIPVKIHIIYNYEYKIENENIDINEYLLNNSVEDHLSKFIINRYTDDLNQESKQKIFEHVIQKYKEEQQLPDEIKNNNCYFELNDYSYMVKHNKYSSRNGDSSEFYFDCIYFNEYIRLGLFQSEEMKERIRKIANSILVDASLKAYEIKSSKEYEQKDIIVNLKNLKVIAAYADDYASDLYFKVLHYNQRENYNSINEKMRQLNYNDNLEPHEKKSLFQQYTKDIKEYLDDIIGSLPCSMQYIEKTIDETKKRHEKIIENIKIVRKKEKP